MPILSVDAERGSVLLNVDGAVENWTSNPEDPWMVNDAIASVDEYINKVDMGITGDGFHARCSIYEALLYLPPAPFANEYMREMRKRQGFVSDRGPSFLHILGESNNGKSVFLFLTEEFVTAQAILPPFRIC